MNNTIFLQSIVCASALVLGCSAVEHSGSLRGENHMSVSMTTRVYKTIGDVALHLDIFTPPGSNAPRAAIIFFFGGAWRGGSTAQFHPQAQRLAERGMVAIAAEYRVKTRHGVTPRECVQDAKSAVRWVRAHAAELGVDPQRIAAGGGSAGGHLAACTALIAGLDETNEPAAISSKPAALVLFNPALDLTPDGFRPYVPAEQAAELSPLLHVAPGAPPTIIFHGTADTTVPFAQAQRFTEAMQRAGNSCELVPYEGKQHAFFNYNAAGNPSFDDTLARTEQFLERLGYLPRAATQ